MEGELNLQPIGFVRSCFPCKNGTPRQPTIASKARGQLKISKGIYNNPAHALEGLQEFTHVWLIFVFHKNKPGKFVKAKVSPPRLNGAKMGVFATRSPYRLNPVGLSLVKLESVEGDTLHFSGHDLVDGTPVLDIKPYIREYDSPRDRQADLKPSSAPPAEDLPLSWDASQPRSDELEKLVNSADLTEVPQTPNVGSSYRECAPDRGEPQPGCDAVDRLYDSADNVTETTTEERPSQGHCDPELVKDKGGARTCDRAESQPDGSSAAEAPPDPGDPPVRSDSSPLKESDDTWLSRLRPDRWTVSFTAWAESQLRRFSAAEQAGPYRLRWLRDATELRGALEQLLTADPRSVYRRAQNDQLLYHLALDASHVTCWFDPTRRVIEVLRLQPLSESPLADVASKAAGDGAATLDGLNAEEFSGDAR